GDRSFYAYNTTVVNGFSLSGDTASATVQGNGAPGIHLYFVDQKPIPQPQVTSGGMPSAANFYVGVFAADSNRSYGFTLAPNPNTYQPNTLGLAHRPHNAATSWAGLTALNNPVISINSRPAPEQLALVDRCPTPNLIPDTARCDSVRLVVTGPYDQYLWSNNDTGNSRWVTQSGKVWVQARDTTNGCTVADTAQVNIIDPATISLFPDDTLVCNSDFIELTANLPGVLSWQWSNGQTDSVSRFFNPDTFWVKLFLPGGCTVADTIVVDFSEDKEPMVIERRTLCPGEEITVDIDPLEFVRVTWSTGSTDFSETFTTPGTYGVAAEKPDGCIEYDSLYLLPPPGADSAQVYEDTSFCAADGGIRLLSPDSFDVRWPNNSDSLFIVNETQVVRAEISDSCTNWVEFFSVNKVDCGCQVKMPNAFTPNGDGLNEIFKPIGTCEFTDYNLVIFNRWGIKIFETNEIGRGFDGKLNEEVLPQGAYMYRFTYETESVENRLTGSFQLLK
ncbi:MAG: gliding motility-associated C-terminal domain-containing protein, partial [Schleiferiaceae bacterium]|nr:gliding motility-associated C-terminal domain-containing protein [Schleiferiaceae bacterium]MDR9443151.1 gliding motility-associated C-terminal domain-containing protein [Schleiferiaceae bacterium]